MSQRLCVGILWLVSAPIVLAQVRMPAQQSAFAPRPLTLRDGGIIVNAAWEREQQAGRKPDCSHLVHEAYTLAGYPYPYADSFHLYAGLENFIRVAKPQPGDLVVWRGHVGIVVDPAEHSFFSSVRSGLHTDSYDAPAWKARGPARFYRYVTTMPENLTLAKERVARTANDPVHTLTVPGADDSGETPSSPQPITSGSESTTTALTPGFRLRSVEPAFEIPSSIIVPASQQKPTRAEIAEAISELNDGTGNILREKNLSQLNRKVIIYDDLNIDRAEFKGTRGSAQARIESRVTLFGESIERKPRHEKFRWELLRVSSGWEVLVPKDRVYVPRDVAVRMLAARLASLAQGSRVSDSDPSIRQQARIVHVLSALFEESP
jgi:hypothetical protein